MTDPSAPTIGSFWSSKTSHALKWLFIAIVTFFVARYLYSLGNGRTFFYDEWNFVVERRSFSWSSFVEPHNGHLSFLPALAYWIMFQIFGLDHFVPYRLMGIAVHLAVCGVAGVLVARRWNWLVGCAVAYSLALMGGGWQNIFWPFQIGLMGSLLFVLLAVDAYDRSKAGASRNWLIAASIFCVAAILCSGVGIPGVGAFALLCWLPASREKTWWVPVPAIVLYGFWYLFYGRSGQNIGELAKMPSYVGESGQAAVSDFLTVGNFFGWVGLSVVTAVVLLAIVRRKATWRMLVWPLFVLSFWILNALTRAGLSIPGASRYVYISIVLLVLTIFDAIPLWPNKRNIRIVLSALIVLLSIITVQRSNQLLRDGAGGLRYEGERISYELAVVDAIGDQLDPNFEIDPVHAPGLTVGEYLAATRDLHSSPAYPRESVENITTANAFGADSVAAGIDRLLDHLLFVTSTNEPASNCRPIPPETKVIEFSSGQTVYVLSSTTQQIRISRYATAGEPGAAPREISAGVIEFRSPADSFGKPWKVSFSDPVLNLVCR